MRLSTSYHKTVTPQNLMEIVDRTAARIKEWIEAGNSITHIVATGSSGQAVAWPVSYKLGIPVCIVRKPAEASHDGNVSGSGDLGDYIVIDDLISSGATIKRVQKEIGDQFERSRRWDNLVSDLINAATPRCKAIFLYSDEWNDDRTEFDTIPVIHTHGGLV